MRLKLFLFFALPLLPSSGLVSQEPQQTEPKPLIRDGVFVPAESQAIALEMRAYSGELRFTYVADHGSFVNEGDTIAKIDTKSLDKQIEQAKIDADSAKIRHQSAVERARMEVESAKLTEATTRASLERARRALEGWEKYELDFARRQSELSAQYAKDGISDAQDEFDQLLAMYSDDELTDATEEIVLKRSRRDLARSKISQQLQDERRKYTATYDWPNSGERRREAVLQQELAMAHFMQQLDLDAQNREDRIRRSKRDLKKALDHVAHLEEDAKLFVLNAPRSGVFLHGSLDDYGRGSAAPRYKAGGNGVQRKELFMVANPDRLKVALSIPEPNYRDVKNGMAVKVRPAIAPDLEWVGSLKMERYPNPRSAGAPENNYDAQVSIDRTLPGIVVGMRAKVELPPSHSGSATIIR